jgi:hypothetical protein
LQSGFWQICMALEDVNCQKGIVWLDIYAFWAKGHNKHLHKDNVWGVGPRGQILKYICWQPQHTP